MYVTNLDLTKAVGQGGRVASGMNSKDPVPKHSRIHQLKAGSGKNLSISDHDLLLFDLLPDVMGCHGSFRNSWAVPDKSFRSVTVDMSALPASPDLADNRYRRSWIMTDVQSSFRAKPWRDGAKTSGCSETPSFI
jgi:hypothetical protein